MTFCAADSRIHDVIFPLLISKDRQNICQYYDDGTTKHDDLYARGDPVSTG
jgi:hypothetical protein